jgi:hypothetical protein
MHRQSDIQVNKPLIIRSLFPQVCKSKSYATGTYSYVGQIQALTRLIGTGSYRYVGICGSRRTDEVSSYRYLPVCGYLLIQALH